MIKLSNTIVARTISATSWSTTAIIVPGTSRFLLSPLHYLMSSHLPKQSCYHIHFPSSWSCSSWPWCHPSPCFPQEGFFTPQTRSHTSHILDLVPLFLLVLLFLLSQVIFCFNCIATNVRENLLMDIVIFVHLPKHTTRTCLCAVPL
jgi:hypothetical protein